MCSFHPYFIFYLYVCQQSIELLFLTSTGEIILQYFIRRFASFPWCYFEDPCLFKNGAHSFSLLLQLSLCVRVRSRNSHLGGFVHQSHSHCSRVTLRGQGRSPGAGLRCEGLDTERWAACSTPQFTSTLSSPHPPPQQAASSHRPSHSAACPDCPLFSVSHRQ